MPDRPVLDDGRGGVIEVASIVVNYYLPEQENGRGWVLFSREAWYDEYGRPDEHSDDEFERQLKILEGFESIDVDPRSNQVDHYVIRLDANTYTTRSALRAVKKAAEAARKCGVRLEARGRTLETLPAWVEPED